MNESLMNFKKLHPNLADVEITGKLLEEIAKLKAEVRG